jgi:hypothetical protein
MSVHNVRFFTNERNNALVVCESSWRIGLSTVVRFLKCETNKTLVRKSSGVALSVNPGAILRISSLLKYFDMNDQGNYSSGPEIGSRL